ncbi:MAG: TonB-dependent receptor [Ignavibacteria bacterium]|nr:TonB-dependent receptor [Ignavibacteria bacterium]
MLKQLSVLLFFSSFVFPQSGDTLLIQNNQSKFDTTFVESTDTLLTSDTTKTEQTTAKADTLIPIQGQPLTDVSTIIGRNTFLFENYRYTGDLLRSFNLNFIKDLGFIGYPNESFIYGVGNSAISYMLDGVLWNNRYTNSLDLNLVQSEDIDSIEIVPSPRGFLYGPYNNPVTVNFITRDFVVPVPYARVKYYQGPDAEAMIDGRFSALLAKRWNLSFEVTNRSIDSTYTNTAFSFWQINAKLKYFLSNSVNITGWYYFVSNKQGLNGGVNVDSLANIPPSFNIDMYSPEAPVIYPNQKLDVLQNNFGLRTLAKPFDNSKLDLSFYYRYNLNQLKNPFNQNSSTNEDFVETLGGLLNYNQKINFIKIALLGVYEDTKINLDRQQSWDSTGAVQNWDKTSLSGSIYCLRTYLITFSFLQFTINMQVRNFHS